MVWCILKISQSDSNHRKHLTAAYSNHTSDHMSCHVNLSQAQTLHSYRLCDYLPWSKALSICGQRYMGQDSHSKKEPQRDAQMVHPYHVPARYILTLASTWLEIAYLRESISLFITFVNII